jgi:hypothetical protein
MELTVGSLLEPPFPTVGPDEDVYGLEAPQVFPAVLSETWKYQGMSAIRCRGAWAGSLMAQERAAAISCNSPPVPSIRTGRILQGDHCAVFQTSTFAQSAHLESIRYDYSRTDNPTRTTLQTPSQRAGGGEYCLAFSSGMGAATPRCCFSSRGSSSPHARLAAPIGFSVRCCKTWGSHFPSLKPQRQRVERAIRGGSRLVWIADKPAAPDYRHPCGASSHVALCLITTPSSPFSGLGARRRSRPSLHNKMLAGTRTWSGGDLP